MTGGALGAVRLIEKEKERKQDGVVYMYICNHFTDHKIQGYINLTKWTNGGSRWRICMLTSQITVRV